MSADAKTTASQLNSLIEICKDGQKGFQEAAEIVHCNELKAELQGYSRQRAEFATVLQSEVSRLGVTPEKGGSVAGAIHRGWINLKTALTSNDDQAVINECERGEDSAVAAYQDAMKADLAPQVTALLSKQYQSVKQAHDKIRDLRDSGKLQKA
jgi:uncharacterized protein (TIGR02284 family)